MHPLDKFGPKLVGFDLETTGLNAAEDRIWEIGICDLDRPLLSTFVNPGRPIPDEVQRKCHLTTDDLRAIDAAPPFATIARQVLDALTDAVIVGHNIWQYDLPLLSQELHRCGLALDRDRVTVLDTKSLFATLEPRTLVAAVNYYCGRDHSGAHRAMADAAAALEVLAGMHERLEWLTHEGGHAAQALIPQYSALAACEDARELAEWSAPDRRLDWAGNFILGEGDVPCFGFGKGKRGTPVAHDLGFLRWMMGKSFPADTIRVAARLLRELSPTPPVESADEMVLH